MRNRWSRFAVLVSLAVLSPALAAAQKLDKDDRAWLDEVRPLMTQDEDKTYRGLKEKSDRLEFQKIFWARRDPDLASPENETQAEFQKLRAEADQKFRVAGGVNTDCFRTWVLLGKPTEIQSDATSPTQLAPQTWTYRGEGFAGGKAEVSFDPECRAPGGFASQLDRVAQAKVLQPNIDYKRGKDGRIVKLQDQLPRDTAARALLRAPRQDFPIALQPAYLKVADGGTALLGLVRGEAGSLSASGGHVSLSVAASAVHEDGKEAGWAEQTMNVPVGPDGAFVASFKLGLKPGKYSLRTAVVDVKGGKASLATTPVEVPDFSKVETAADGTTTKVSTAGSVVIVRSIEPLPAGGSDPAHPLAAFELGQVRLVPAFGGVVKKSEQVEFFYQVYDLKVDPATGKADAVAMVSILKDGKTPVAKAPANPIDTEMAGSSVGPVPMGAYDPGKYVVQLRVTDKLAKRDVVQETPLEIVP